MYYFLRKTFISSDRPIISFTIMIYRKQCVHNYDVYDFLKNVVNKVPDLGSPDASADDKLGKRR